MSPIKRGDIYYLYVPKQKGGVILRTTGTTSHRIYTLMRGMLARLKADRRWALLTAIIDGTLSMGAVFDADRTKALDALEASLSASVLAPHAVAYLADCKARGLAPRNIENITRQLASFCAFGAASRAGAPLTTADLTPATVTAWLASLTSSPGTRRQFLYAVTGLTRYLVRIEVLTDYPLSRVKAPKKNAARMTYVDAATDERIVQASRPDVRALFAFIKGTGCDVTTALHTRRCDVSVAGTARLKGTKTAQRDVHKALVETWARRYLASALNDTLPNAPLFPGLNRSIAAHQHTAACKAVGVTGYTLKDARHSVAVRMMEAGYNVQEIAEQLGNSPELVARVYSRFAPKMDRRVTAHVTEAAK